MHQPLPDTVYDRSHAWRWQNMNDRVMYERNFAGGTYEDRQIAQAMIVANPETPNAEIQEKMTVPAPPPRTGIISEQLTINDVLSVSLEDVHSHDMHTTDFSGRVSGYEGSSFPSLPMW